MQFLGYILTLTGPLLVSAAFDARHDACQPAADAYQGIESPNNSLCHITLRVGKTVQFSCGSDNVLYDYDRNTLRPILEAGTTEEDDESFTMHAACYTPSGQVAHADLRVPKPHGSTSTSRHIYPGLNRKCDISVPNVRLAISTYSLTAAQLATCGKTVVSPIA